MAARQLLGGSAPPGTPICLVADPALPAGLRPHCHGALGEHGTATAAFEGGRWPCPGRREGGRGRPPPAELQSGPGAPGRRWSGTLLLRRPRKGAAQKHPAFLPLSLYKSILFFLFPKHNVGFFLLLLFSFRMSSPVADNPPSRCIHFTPDLGHICHPAQGMAMARTPPARPEPRDGCAEQRAATELEVGCGWRPRMLLFSFIFSFPHPITAHARAQPGVTQGIARWGQAGRPPAPG